MNVTFNTNSFAKNTQNYNQNKLKGVNGMNALLS